MRGAAALFHRELQVAETPLERAVVYFNNAGRTPLLRASVIAGHAAVESKARPWRLVDQHEATSRVRELFATIIDAPSGGRDVAICPSTSCSLSVVARHFGRDGRGLICRGSHVVVLDGQMASNVMPWQAACESVGATLTVVARPANYDWGAALIAAFASIAAAGERVGVLALPQCHWCDGSVVDISAAAADLRARWGSERTALVLDITQSAGIAATSVAALRPDFVCASAHKCLLGPYGFSLLYADPKHTDAALANGAALASASDQHERSRFGSEDPAWDEVGAMTRERGYPTRFFRGARRLDAGGRPNPVGIPMLVAALEQVAAWHGPHGPTVAGGSAVARSVAPLIDRIATHAASLGYDVPPRARRAANFVGIRLSRASAHLPPPTELKRILRERGNVRVCVRVGALRVSLYVYNTHAEVDLFNRLLSDAVASAAPRGARL
jgi:selenocysteine lyase/cysteine desulfurase